MGAAIRAAALYILICICFQGAAADEKRVALVIGNAAYRSAAALRNTLNDADAMSKALREVGFEVMDGRDLDKTGADRMLAAFAGAIQQADAVLFYFAGHGLQVAGQNYLLPVDARGEDELSLPFESTRLNDVIALLGQSSGVRILVLDACRNNPFSALLTQKQGARGAGATRGLARAEQAQGMLVAYATQPNEVAEDGAAGNSPFTEEMVRAIREPGVKIGETFQNVVARVHRRTEGRQTPEVSFSLVGAFTFNQAETDLEAWKKAASSNDLQQLQAFVARFPESPWAASARTLIDAIGSNRRRDELAEQLRVQNIRLEQLQARLRRTQDEDAARPRERTQAELEAKRRLAAAMETEKARIENERARLEQALAQRLATAPAARPAGERPAAPEPVAPRPRPASCSEILARVQLGEMTAADVEALKTCR